MTRASLLLVDDRPQNLLALEAILEPLGQELVSVRSGEEALRELLRGEFAAILLDVQMPGLDGFETAALIKQRERTSHVPIIFLTALSKDTDHVFRGYEAGAVDYILKPFDPDMLRSKVSVFVELWRKEQALREREVKAARQESEQRYQSLAAAVPAIVWQADPMGNASYYNERWFEYTGIAPARQAETDWHDVIHPDDFPRTLAAWEESARTGVVFENEYRFRRADGTYRWHLGRAVPLRDARGEVASWIGTAVDIDDRKRAEERQNFLVQAGELLGRSLDYEQALKDVAGAAVAGMADWCIVDVLADDGSIRLLTAAHSDPVKVRLAEELRERYPPDPDSPRGASLVIRTGEPQLATDIDDAMLQAGARDETHLQLLRELGLRSYVSVPLRARERTIGAITLVLAESGRNFGPADLALAEELARRAGTAIENAELYEEVEERAQAARVLDAVGDGVVLVDQNGIVRLWNPAAETITGIRAGEIVGRRADEVIRTWPAGTADAPRVETVPVEVQGRELWLSISGVALEEGTVYAFRDLTEERVLERLKSEFVATVSHEIRTPLAAVHGAALTLLRRDLELEDDIQTRLLQVIGDESARLATIVNDLLLASHLDSGRLPVSIESCDARELAGSVVEAARAHAASSVEVTLSAPDDLPPVAADPGQLRQVLANLVDNAIKYSPDGGPVELRAEESDGHLRFEVVDKGLGIPPSEHPRVFEKFYRLDPNMTRGIGGTGLGLYISRELVRNMDGRIWVESRLGAGSMFVVEIPLAPVKGRRKRKAASRA
ncbi:MAG: ATP-binding protein [Gaiellaceae bacterium]